MALRLHIQMGGSKMSLSRISRYYSLAARFGIAFAALSTWLIVPVASAQYSSSAAYHLDMSNLLQDQNQYPNQGGYSRQGYPYHTDNSRWSHIAFEAGGGFNRPMGNTRAFATWGGNLTIGAGWRFSRIVSVLAEWQFIDNKIPGGYLANIGVPGGHIHTWGLTLEPTIDYAHWGNLGGYVIGGGGFYRRVTTFTVPQQQEVCFYFCYIESVNVPIARYSSNQGGLNIGTGVTWSAFGPESNGKLFAEIRYVHVNSPVRNVFGTPDGTEGFLPVTVGFRW